MITGRSDFDYTQTAVRPENGGRIGIFADRFQKLPKDGCSDVH